MPFKDREDAGRKLAAALAGQAGRKDVTVVALPRGGVVLGRVVADALAAPLDLVVPRKIGALTESGEAVWNEAERAAADPQALEEVIAREKAEAIRRLTTYREGLPPRAFKDRTLIVVDDGAATGLTMRAALVSLRRETPARLLVALPVCSRDAKEAIEATADETIVLETPDAFGAVGAFYERFPQVDDAQVIGLMHPKR